ncbi:porin family protein [Prevotella sp.]|uniref:porin family protein n=1 Tax=Prevotella sp. TaxID=59823 RepID=UPI002F95239D
MKKIVLAAMLMLSTAAAFAQRSVGSLTLQPKVGLNVATITEANADAKVGLAAGLELEYQVADIVSVSAGVLYSGQGAKWDGISLEVPGFGKANLGSGKFSPSYINVPIMANVYVVNGLAVKLGVQPGFAVDKADSDINTVDFSIPVGASYEYKNIVLDARYNWGVTKLYDGGKSKNSVFQVTLGYKFDL